MRICGGVRAAPLGDTRAVQRRRGRRGRIERKKREDKDKRGREIGEDEAEREGAKKGYGFRGIEYSTHTTNMFIYNYRMANRRPDVVVYIDIELN